jgi:hypothetical protein
VERASATARVPAENASNSNTPIGPFQNTVFAPAIFSANSAADFGPMSRPIWPAGMSSEATTVAGASAENSGATALSTGSTISTPFFSAVAR